MDILSLAESGVNGRGGALQSPKPSRVTPSSDLTFRLAMGKGLLSYPLIVSGSNAAPQHVTLSEAKGLPGDAWQILRRPTALLRMTVFGQALFNSEADR